MIENVSESQLINFRVLGRTRGQYPNSGANILNFSVSLTIPIICSVRWVTFSMLLSGVGAIDGD